ncbi:hypothetical protein ACI65C_001446 [Semiaphis heraclei]
MREKRSVAPQRRTVGTWRDLPLHRHHTISRKYAISVWLPHHAQFGDVDAKVRQQQQTTTTTKTSDGGEENPRLFLDAKCVRPGGRFLPVVDLCWLGLRFPRGMVVVFAYTRPQLNNETF